MPWVSTNTTRRLAQRFAIVFPWREERQTSLLQMLQLRHLKPRPPPEKLPGFQCNARVTWWHNSTMVLASLQTKYTRIRCVRQSNRNLWKIGRVHRGHMAEMPLNPLRAGVHLEGQSPHCVHLQNHSVTLPTRSVWQHIPRRRCWISQRCFCRTQLIKPLREH